MDDDARRTGTGFHFLGVAKKKRSDNTQNFKTQEQRRLILHLWQRDWRELLRWGRLRRSRTPRPRPSTLGPLKVRRQARCKFREVAVNGLDVDFIVSRE